MPQTFSWDQIILAARHPPSGLKPISRNWPPVYCVSDLYTWLMRHYVSDARISTAMQIVQEMFESGFIVKTNSKDSISKILPEHLFSFNCDLPNQPLNMIFCPESKSSTTPLILSQLALEAGFQVFACCKELSSQDILFAAYSKFSQLAYLFVSVDLNQNFSKPPAPLRYQPEDFSISNLNNYPSDLINEITLQYAFWVNCANCLFLHSILFYGSIPSDMGKITYRIGGYNFSYNDIVFGILCQNKSSGQGKGPQFAKKDPRIRFIVPKTFPALFTHLANGFCDGPPIEPLAAYHEDNMNSYLRTILLVDPNQYQIFLPKWFCDPINPLFREAKQPATALRPYLNLEKRMILDKLLKHAQTIGDPLDINYYSPSSSYQSIRYIHDGCILSVELNYILEFRELCFEKFRLFQFGQLSQSSIVQPRAIIRRENLRNPFELNPLTEHRFHQLLANPIQLSLVFLFRCSNIYTTTDNQSRANLQFIERNILPLYVQLDLEDYEALNDCGKAAFWINTYNGLCLIVFALINHSSFIPHDPEYLRTVFKGHFIQVFGENFVSMWDILCNVLNLQNYVYAGLQLDPEPLSEGATSSATSPSSSDPTKIPRPESRKSMESRSSIGSSSLYQTSTSASNSAASSSNSSSMSSEVIATAENQSPRLGKLGAQQSPRRLSLSSPKNSPRAISSSPRPKISPRTPLKSSRGGMRRMSNLKSRGSMIFSSKTSQATKLSETISESSYFFSELESSDPSLIFCVFGIISQFISPFYGGSQEFFVATQKYLESFLFLEKIIDGKEEFTLFIPKRVGSEEFLSSMSFSTVCQLLSIFHPLHPRLKQMKKPESTCQFSDDPIKSITFYNFPSSTIKSKIDSLTGYQLEVKKSPFFNFVGFSSDNIATKFGFSTAFGNANPSLFPSSSPKSVSLKSISSINQTLPASSPVLDSSNSFDTHVPHFLTFSGSVNSKMRSKLPSQLSSDDDSSGSLIRTHDLLSRIFYSDLPSTTPKDMYFGSDAITPEGFKGNVIVCCAIRSKSNHILCDWNTGNLPLVSFQYIPQNGQHDYIGSVTHILNHIHNFMDPPPLTHSPLFPHLLDACKYLQSFVKIPLEEFRLNYFFHQSNVVFVFEMAVRNHIPIRNCVWSPFESFSLFPNQTQTQFYETLLYQFYPLNKIFKSISARYNITRPQPGLYVGFLFVVTDLSGIRVVVRNSDPEFCPTIRLRSDLLRDFEMETLSMLSKNLISHEFNNEESITDQFAQLVTELAKIVNVESIKETSTSQPLTSQKNYANHSLSPSISILDRLLQNIDSMAPFLEFPETEPFSNLYPKFPFIDENNNSQIILFYSQVHDPTSLPKDLFEDYSFIPLRLINTFSYHKGFRSSYKNFLATLQKTNYSSNAIKLWSNKQFLEDCISHFASSNSGI